MLSMLKSSFQKHQDQMTVKTLNKITFTPKFNSGCTICTSKDSQENYNKL